MRRNRSKLLLVVGVIGVGLAALFLASPVSLLRSPKAEVGSALASREAMFRSQMTSGQSLYLVVERYRRQPPLPSSVKPDVDLRGEHWVSESYTTLDIDGYVSGELTFERRADGARVPTRVIAGQHAKIYGPDGKLMRELDYPSRLPFDMGYSALRSYVDRLFPKTAIETEGGGITVLVSEIEDPSSYPTLLDQTELRGLDVKRVRIRWEIDEDNGLLMLYQETAVLGKGEELVVSEDRVTTAEIVPAPDVLERGGP